MFVNTMHPKFGNGGSNKLPSYGSVMKSERVRGADRWDQQWDCQPTPPPHCPTTDS